MTIFEYLSIAASIVLALALGKLATATPPCFLNVDSMLFIPCSLSPFFPRPHSTVLCPETG